MMILPIGASNNFSNFRTCVNLELSPDFLSCKSDELWIISVPLALERTPELFSKFSIYIFQVSGGRCKVFTCMNLIMMQ